MQRKFLSFMKFASTQISIVKLNMWIWALNYTSFTDMRWCIFDIVSVADADKVFPSAFLKKIEILIWIQISFWKFVACAVY